jgi:hypothetical protein
MFRDTNLEFSPWGTRVGPGIGSPGSPNPTTFTATPATKANPHLIVSTVGAAYADGMAVQQRPWITPFDPSQIMIRYEFDLLVPDGNMLQFAQAIETDLRISSPSGWNYNGSFQNNIEQKGEIQVYGVAPAPAWQNTGLMVGLYATLENYHVEINYLINDTNAAAHGMPAWSMSFLPFSINGKLYTVPASMQNSVGAKLNWTPGIYEQLQLDRNAQPTGAFEVEFENIAIDWM